MVFLLAVLGAQFAFADGVAADIAAARASLIAGDLSTGRDQLRKARNGAAVMDSLIDAQTVGELLWLEAMVPRLMGASRPEDDERLRESLAAFPELQWDRELSDDPGLRGFFEALRDEVRNRETAPTQVPNPRGKAKAYVDGVEHIEDQAVRKGTHLAQVSCPGGKVFSRWTRFDREFDWLSMCPEIVDITAPPVVLAEGTDDFDFGGLDEPRSGPEPLAWVPPPPKVVIREPLDPRLLWYGAGGAAAVATGVYIAALLNKSAYNNLDQPEFRTPGALEAQREKTNRQVGVASGFAVVAVGVGAYAVFQGRF